MIIFQVLSNALDWLLIGRIKLMCDVNILDLSSTLRIMHRGLDQVLTIIFYLFDQSVALK